jgi:polyhydroxybutyrate depolymerase
MVTSRVLSAGVALGLALSGCGSSPSESDSTEPEGSAPTGSAPAGSAGTAAGNSGGSSAGNGSGSGTSGGGGSSGSGAGASDVVRSQGCGRAAEFESGTQTIDVGGLSRSFILDLPTGYQSSKAYPLLFGFHGRGFSATEFRSASYGNLLSVAGRAAIVVHPDAAGDADAERYWETENDQDVLFFDAMLDALTEGLCVDEARVFAAGHSSGGYFTNVLGCQRGDVLRAIAPVAGGGPFGTGGGAPSCERPLSAWIAHAEDDQTVPFPNGEGSRDYWLESDDCSDSSFESVDPNPCVAYDGCARGLAVRWCVYDGGHDWPSFATQGIWEFFASF